MQKYYLFSEVTKNLQRELFFFALENTFQTCFSLKKVTFFNGNYITLQLFIHNAEYSVSLFVHWIILRLMLARLN